MLSPYTYPYGQAEGPPKADPDPDIATTLLHGLTLAAPVIPRLPLLQASTPRSALRGGAGTRRSPAAVYATRRAGCTARSDL